MKPNTALALAMAGCALLMATGQFSVGIRSVGQLFAMAVIANGALALAEYVTGASFGIDQILFVADPGDAPVFQPRQNGAGYGHLSDAKRSGDHFA